MKKIRCFACAKVVPKKEMYFRIACMAEWLYFSSVRARSYGLYLSTFSSKSSLRIHIKIHQLVKGRNLRVLDHYRLQVKSTIRDEPLQKVNMNMLKYCQYKLSSDFTQAHQRSHRTRGRCNRAPHHLHKIENKIECQNQIGKLSSMSLLRESGLAWGTRTLLSPYTSFSRLAVAWCPNIIVEKNICLHMHRVKDGKQRSDLNRRCELNSACKYNPTWRLEIVCNRRY